MRCKSDLLGIRDSKKSLNLHRMIQETSNNLTCENHCSWTAFGPLSLRYACEKKCKSILTSSKASRKFAVKPITPMFVRSSPSSWPKSRHTHHLFLPLLQMSRSTTSWRLTTRSGRRECESCKSKTRTAARSSAQALTTPKECGSMKRRWSL